MKNLFFLLLLFNINLFSQTLLFKANYVNIINLQNELHTFNEINIKIKIQDDNVYFSTGKVFTVISDIKEKENILYCYAIDENGKRCKIFITIKDINKILFALEYKDFIFIYHCILLK